MDKHDKFEEEIAPLMGKVFEICQREHIAMLCHFEIGSVVMPGLRCTNFVATPDCEPSDRLFDAIEIAYGKPIGKVTAEATAKRANAS
jgi:hypothetical protein